MTLHVTDHAIIRYLERVLHLDMDKVREDIRSMATDTVPMAGPPYGAHMHSKGKAMFIIHGERVVTVIGRREIERSKHWMGDVLEAAE